MTSLGLLNRNSGLNPVSSSVTIGLTTMAYQLYARAQGHTGNPEEFFGDRIRSISTNQLLLNGTIVTDAETWYAQSGQPPGPRWW